MFSKDLDAKSLRHRPVLSLQILASNTTLLTSRAQIPWALEVDGDSAQPYAAGQSVTRNKLVSTLNSRLHVKSDQKLLSDDFAKKILGWRTEFREGHDRRSC